MIGVGFALSLGLLAAMITLYPNHISSQTASVGLGPGPYSGRIVLEAIARKRCRQVTFGNRTGRVTEMKEENRPCKELADLPADDRGQPKPLGTISRRDAIAKSFSNG
jgi:hypothetical protein